MRSWFPSIVLNMALLAISTVFCAQAFGAPKLYIVSINDLHGQIFESDEKRGGLPRVLSFITELKERAEAENGLVIAVFPGDTFSGTFLSDVTKGELVAESLNIVNERTDFSFATLGNHAFNYSPEELAALKEKLDFPIIVSNLEGGPPFFAKTMTVPLEFGDQTLKLGVLGFLTREVAPEANGFGKRYEVMRPLESVVSLEKELAGADFTIALSHLGVGNSKTRSQSFQTSKTLYEGAPFINAVFSGHHHEVSFFEKQGRPLIESGSRASTISLSQFSLKERSDRYSLEFEKHEFIQLDQTTPELMGPFASVLQKAHSIERKYAAPFAWSKSSWNGDYKNLRTRQTPLGIFIADTLRESVKTDSPTITVLNSGSIRAGLPSGFITKKDIFELYPLEEPVVSIRVSVSEFKLCLKKLLKLRRRTGLYPQFSSNLVFRPKDGKFLKTDSQVDESQIIVDGNIVAPDTEITLLMTYFMAKAPSLERMKIDSVLGNGRDILFREMSKLKTIELGTGEVLPNLPIQHYKKIARKQLFKEAIHDGNRGNPLCGTQFE